MERPICEAFAVLVDLGVAVGAEPLSKYPACWEYDIDEHWAVAVNGHQEEMLTSDGVALPPFYCAVKFNGWPAGVFSPFGGGFVAGSLANEDTFIQALKAKLQKLAAEKEAKGGTDDSDNPG